MKTSEVFDTERAFLGLTAGLAFDKSSQTTIPLHTQSLEACYGPVSAQVVHHDSRTRVVDIVDAKGICRTHALTWFPLVLEGDMKVVQDEVAQGELIGQTLKKHGYRKVSIPLAEGVVRIPTELQDRFHVTEEFAAFLLYIFIATDSKVQYIFGVIAEIYSPDFKHTNCTVDSKTTYVNEVAIAPFLTSLQNYLVS